MNGRSDFYFKLIKFSRILSQHLPKISFFATNRPSQSDDTQIFRQKLRMIGPRKKEYISTPSKENPSFLALRFTIQ